MFNDDEINFSEFKESKISFRHSDVHYKEEQKKISDLMSVKGLTANNWKELFEILKSRKYKKQFVEMFPKEKSLLNKLLH